MPTVDVIIPTWNKRELVLGALETLAKQSLDHHVYVVDNGSTDGTAVAIARQFPDVTVRGLTTNHGFGRAVNIGIRSGDGDIVVIINNDIEAEPDFLAELVTLFDDPSIGCVAGVLLSAEGLVIDAAGISVDRSLAGYSHLHGVPESSRVDPVGAFAPCGGAAAYRRELLEAVGLYDEEIFAYSEDVELGLRLAAAGAKTATAWRARVRHLGSATLGHRSAAQLRISSWSRGYVMGRYRVGSLIGLELALAAIDCVSHRSLVPLTQRLDGYRRGRSLPPRARPDIDYLPLRVGLLRRWNSFRGRY